MSRTTTPREDDEHHRSARTAAVVTGSRENTKRFHNPALADPEAAIRYVAAEWQPEKVRQRYDWLFDYDATTAELRARVRTHNGGVG